MNALFEIIILACTYNLDTHDDNKAGAEAELARFFWLDQSMRSTS